MGVVSRFASIRDKALTARHECWLIVGLFVINIGAAIPFGVSSPDPNAGLTPSEWVSSVAIGILAFAILAGMFNNRILSWSGLAGGMIWTAVAAVTLHDNLDSDISWETKAALLFIPLGIAMAHLSLERYVERPKNLRETDTKPV